ncbi:hypothetical protein GF318_03080 [Candidatus Micrarchaeota archaeon]|nr:hypothetical protein [Candidatus Micrarchaeota archaeon]
MEVLLPLLLTLPASAGMMIGMSIGLGIMVVAIMFMIAYGLQNPQMIAIAKEELAAFLFTIFIILFWLSLDASLNDITIGILASSLPSELQPFLAESATHGGYVISHHNLAIASLDIMIQKLKHQYIDLYLFEALIGFLSTISFPLGSPVPALNVISFSLAPFTGLVLLSNAHTAIVEAIGYMITLVWAKQFIVIFARDAVPILLLPLGLVLRAFPFFRRTGSSVIAVAFAMYFVLPFAVILSNYLIFDVYQPADFAYTPVHSSFFDTEKSYGDWNSDLSQGQEEQSGHLMEQFTAPDAAEAAHTAGEECSGNFVVRLLCSIKNVVKAAWNAAVSFVGTVFTIWRFMVGMTGDFFFGGFNNPLMPASASAGLYYFIIKEVSVVSPFIILVMLTTVIEIVITVTMYRNISLLIGGEAEIIGLTKIV